MEWTWCVWKLLSPRSPQDSVRTGIAAKEEKMAADLKALRVAPLAEPFDGPALLSGRAAAVFFHEVWGIARRGHRKRGEN